MRMRSILALVEKYGARVVCGWNRGAPLPSRKVQPRKDIEKNYVVPKFRAILEESSYLKGNA